MTKQQETQVNEALKKVTDYIVKTNKPQMEAINSMWPGFNFSSDVYKQLAQEGFQNRLSHVIHGSRQGWAKEIQYSKPGSSAQPIKVEVSFLENEYYKVESGLNIPLGEFTKEDCLYYAEEMENAAKGFTRRKEAFVLGAKLLDQYDVKTLQQLPEGGKERLQNIWEEIKISVPVSKQAGSSARV